MQELKKKYDSLKGLEERKKVDAIAKNKSAKGLKAFCKFYLDIDLTPDQFRYEKNSEGKTIVLNRSGNKWGKTFCEALGVIYDAYYKLDLNTKDPEAWLKAEYLQAVAAPEYSGSRTLINELIKIVEGKVLKPDGSTNRSKLKGWFIVKHKGIESDSNQPPVVKFFNNSELWGRSYSGLGASMKQKTFHRIIIDESGDIPELHKFIFATLVPRTAMSRTGQIRIIGTPQGFKYDYSQVINELRGDPNAYIHQGSTKENIYITQQSLNRMLKAYQHDENLMRQVLYGEFVDSGNSVIPGDIIDHAVDVNLPLEQPPLNGHQYVVGIDSAAISDDNSISILDVTQEPFILVKHYSISAKMLPPEVFYADIESLLAEYNHAMAIFDASGPGGQIHQQQLQQKCSNILFISIVGTKTREEKGQINKGDLVVNFREMLSKGRKKRTYYDREGYVSEVIEENPNYGLIRIPNIYELIQQCKIYTWDDKNIQTDRFISLCLACWLASKKSAIAPEISYRRNT